MLQTNTECWIPRQSNVLQHYPPLYATKQKKQKNLNLFVFFLFLFVTKDVAYHLRIYKIYVSVCSKFLFPVLFFFLRIWVVLYISNVMVDVWTISVIFFLFLNFFLVYFFYLKSFVCFCCNSLPNSYPLENKPNKLRTFTDTYIHKYISSCIRGYKTESIVESFHGRKAW